MGLTGKQAAFVHAYLGEARFNATVAAKLAGYRATSKHSFESIGSENLTKPGIRRVIDDYFKLSRMSAEEVLIELTTLARGNSKDKIKALALMSQHHGVLDGRYEAHKSLLEEEKKREYDRGWNACIEELNKEVEQYNAEVVATTKRKDAQWEALKLEYKDCPEAVEALTRLRLLMEGKAEIELPPPTEVQIIPPQRRLEAAPIERLMREVIEPEILPPAPPVRCRHGYLEGQCVVIELGYDCPHYHKRPKPSRYVA